MLAGCSTFKHFSRKYIYLLFIIFNNFIAVHHAFTLQTGSHNIAANLHSWSPSFPSWIWKAAKTAKIHKKTHKKTNVRQLLQVPEEIFVHQHLQTINYPSLLDEQKLLHVRVILQSKLHEQIHALSIPIQRTSLLGHYYLVCGKSVLSNTGVPRSFSHLQVVQNRLTEHLKKDPEPIRKKNHLREIV